VHNNVQFRDAIQIREMLSIGHRALLFLVE
jgi:hypothetical protein